MKRLLPKEARAEGFAYLLECADGTLYAGSTNDLEKRLREHNHSTNGARYTRARRPVILRHAEPFSTLSAARSREAEFKRMSRKEKLELVGKGKPAEKSRG